MIFAHLNLLPRYFASRPLPLCVAEDGSQTSGGLGEHCSSSAVGHGLCALPGRVAQPRLFANHRGKSEGPAQRGRLLWVTFLGKTRKVTSCRAAPGAQLRAMPGRSENHAKPNIKIPLSPLDKGGRQAGRTPRQTTLLNPSPLHESNRCVTTTRRVA